MKKKMLQKNFKVTANNKIKGEYFKLALDAPDIASIAKPGQFVMVEVDKNLTPLLRRPMSIHSVKKDKIEILYEVLGQGTQILAQKKPGEYLNLIGPVGNGVEITKADNKSSILVAGGMGVAPLFFLAEKLVHSQQPIVNSKIRVLIGAKTKNRILCEKEFKRLGCDVKIATDDGSRGFKGPVTELLEQTLSSANSKISHICACGPRPMLKPVAYIASKYNIEASASFEAHMACGIGACMGCVIQIKDATIYNKEGFVYQRVCKDGPVFALNQAIWGEG